MLKKIFSTMVFLSLGMAVPTNYLAAQEKIFMNNFNEGVDVENNVWSNWYIRTDVNYTSNFAFVRKDAVNYLDSVDFRTRMFRKIPGGSGTSPIANLTLTERAPSTSKGGSLHISQKQLSSNNATGWWIWYGGHPISSDLAGIDQNIDRFSLYVKFENINNYQTVHLGTYLSNGGAKEYGNSHYYHQIEPAGGAWLHVLYDRHPNHRRGESGQNNPANNPSLGDFGLHYFPHFFQAYFEIRYPSSSPDVAQFYIDEMYFYSTKNSPEPNQNDDSISSVWVGYFPVSKYWEIGLSDLTEVYGTTGRNEYSWSTYEVRWSTAPITNANWDQATPIQNSTYNQSLEPGQFRKDNSYKALVRTRFTIPDLLEGTSKVYFAIKDISSKGLHKCPSWPCDKGDGRDSLSPYVHTIDYDLFAVDVPASPSNLVVK